MNAQLRLMANRKRSSGLTPRQLFNVYSASCQDVYSVIEVDREGIALEIYHVGEADTASAEWTVQRLIPALLGNCPGIRNCHGIEHCNRRMIR